MTKDEAQELVSKVDNLRASTPGLRVDQACKELGKHFTLFYKARNLLGLPSYGDVNRAKRVGQIAEVNRLVDEGSSVFDACKEVGLNVGTYYHHRKHGDAPVHRKPQSNPVAKKGGFGLIYRVGAQITSDSNGTLHSHCPICNWPTSNRNPRDLNNAMNRHYREKHHSEWEKLKGQKFSFQPDKPVFAALAEEPDRSVGQGIMHLESFTCPHCGSPIVLRAEGEVEVFGKVNLHSNHNHTNSK